jgi:hypothetical protein
MLKYGQEYVDKGMQYYDERYWDQQIGLLKKNAAKLCLHLAFIIDMNGLPHSSFWTDRFLVSDKSAFCR